MYDTSHVTCLQLSLNGQVVNVYCTRRKQFWLTTGDEQLTW